MLPRGSVRSLLLGVLLWAAAGLAAWAGEPAPRPQVWGYYPWWLGDHWRSRELSLYDRLKFFEIEIGAEGQLGQRNGWPQRWDGLQAAARARGLPLDVTVTLFSAPRFEHIFTSPQRRRRLLIELLRLAIEVRGIHLDVEIFDSVSAEALSGYRAFCAELRSGLNRQGGSKALTAFGVMGAAAHTR